MQYIILAWGGASLPILESLAITQKVILKKQFRYSAHLIFYEFKVHDIRQLYST